MDIINVVDARYSYTSCARLCISHHLPGALTRCIVILAVRRARQRSRVRVVPDGNERSWRSGRERGRRTRRRRQCPATVREWYHQLWILADTGRQHHARPRRVGSCCSTQLRTRRRRVGEHHDLGCSGIVWLRSGGRAHNRVRCRRRRRVIILRPSCLRVLWHGSSCRPVAAAARTGRCRGRHHCPRAPDTLAPEVEEG